MDANDYRSKIRAIADALVELPEPEVDDLLRDAGTSDRTPRGWGERPTLARRVALVSLLQQAAEYVVENLWLSLERPQTAVVGRELGRLAVTASAANIFVVHGHARAELHETVRVLERATGLEVIVLHEQSNAGRTILEKFEDYSALASYAVVLLTDDDVGCARSVDEVKPRGRQNVVFELGFFFGKLGRDRVAVLLSEGVERPSDIDGLVYITLDSAGAWKQALARELRSANIPVDYSRIP